MNGRLVVRLRQKANGMVYYTPLGNHLPSLHCNEIKQSVKRQETLALGHKILFPIKEANLLVWKQGNGCRESLKRYNIRFINQQ